MNKRNKTIKRSALRASSVELLEARQMLTTGVVGPVSAITTATTIPAPFYTPTDSNPFDAQHGPLANLGTKLVAMYQSYVTDFAVSAASGNVSPAAAVALSDQIAAEYPGVEMQDGLVGMDINSLGGDFNQFVSSLTSLGMVVTDTSAAYGIAEGYVPMAELQAIARLPQTEAGSLIMASTTHSTVGTGTTPLGFQGIAYNEPETALGADAARMQYNVTGTGVTVGVLSDSVNSVTTNGMTGLAESYSTMDLDPNNPVTVISGQAGSGEDEGRAMLESIHDIAPGANLQFATGFGGDLNFMQNIEALYNAGSKIIVDDISTPDEPYFQDGLVAQAVDYVTARGDEYFTSAANSGADNGYLSTFRPTSSTSMVTVGSGASATTGVFQNFDGTGNTVSPLLKVTTGQANSFVNFQFDEPFKTQEPTGATAVPTSSLSFLVFDANGNLVKDSNGKSISGTDDNTATLQPYQGVTIPTIGTYYVAIQLVSGKAPGHVEFVGLGDDGALQVDKTNGTAGSTTYPSSEGHEISANTIGVGTTAWFNAAPFQNNGIATPVAGGSSTGPGLIDLSPKGTPIIAQVPQNPAFTSTDGGTTSFFGQPAVDTVAFGGTSFNDTPVPQQKLFDFFGTSQAAPNAAAVAALMLQAAPTLSRVQILSALETTALPINNTAKGTYNIQSGYGLINAVAAINAVAPAANPATTTTASSSPDTPASGQAFTLSATVAGTGATPTGTVNIYDISYNMNIGTATLVGGVASFMTSTTQLGAHVYLFTYSGDSANAKSTAYVVLDVVNAPMVHSAVVRAGTNQGGSPPSVNAISSNAGGLTPLTVSTPTPLVVSLPTTSVVSMPINSEVIDAMAVGLTGTSTGEGSPLAVKKHVN